MWRLHYQEFPVGPYEVFALNDEEAARKQALRDWLGTRWVEAGQAKHLFPLAREIYRRVPVERDYTQPPAGLRRHYDEWGRFQVQRGRYRQALTFAEHFVPLIRGLPLLAATASAARSARAA